MCVSVLVIMQIVIVKCLFCWQYKDTGCHDSHCLGSHMWPKDHRPKRSYSHPRSKEEMIPLAEDFIKQYYESKKQ